jgi:hypothetical protein
MKSSNPIFPLSVGDTIKMWRILNDAAHSVYCADPKERKRLNLPGCPACRWQKLRRKLFANLSKKP